MANAEYKEKTEAILQLIAVFKLERLVYVAVNIGCLAAILFIIIYLLLDDKVSLVETLPLCTASGGLIYSTGRLLKMWSDAIAILGGKIPEK